MKAKIRGTEIYYDIAGMKLAPHQNDFIERPTVFLLHGGPGSNHLRYKHHTLALQDSAQLVFIDHRGCGLSKKTKLSDYTLENNIEDIEALRAHLGLETICLLGTSYGGMVAQGYALRYPKRVEKLILVVTAPSYHFIEEAKDYVYNHGTKKQISYVKRLWDGDFKNYKDLLKYFEVMDPLYSVSNRPRHANYSQLKETFSYDVLNYASKNRLWSFNYINKLKKIKCPTLILAGDKDWICSANQSKIIAKNIPHAKLKIFKNCGHALAIDANKQYIGAIKQFLKT